MIRPILVRSTLSLQPGFAFFLRHAVLLQQSGNGIADEGNVFQVNSRFGLVKEHQIGVLGRKLKQFGALDFTPGKAGVDIPVQETLKIDLAGEAVHIDLIVAHKSAPFDVS